MTQGEYSPAAVWQPNSPNGGRFSSINRPTSGSQFQRELPRGNRPIQLCSMATPNGVKVAILLEELIALGIKEAEYDAHLVDILAGDQFSSGFVKVNPNSKIPALIEVDSETPIFESGAILLHLAEKFGNFILEGGRRIECLSWLFWQVGSAPYVGGGFGHFYVYAPSKMQYSIDRFAMEVKRQLHLLDQHLSSRQFICGEQYTIADMAIWPWYGAIVLGQMYDAAEFLDAPSYPNLMRWAGEIEARPAVQIATSVLKG